MPNPQLNYDTVRVEEGNEQKAIELLNQKVDEGKYPVGVLQNDRENGVTTFVLSQGQPTIAQSEPDSSNVHLEYVNNISDEDAIMVDLSDTENYGHENTGYLTLENLLIDVDAGGNADFIIDIGFLKNVDDVDGDFVVIYRLSGTKTKGASKQISAEFFPHGGRLNPDRWLSSEVITDPIYANTNQLPSTPDLDNANVTPENGDLAIRVTRSDTSEINLSYSISYHSRI